MQNYRRKWKACALSSTYTELNTRYPGKQKAILMWRKTYQGKRWNLSAQSTHSTFRALNEVRKCASAQSSVGCRKDTQKEEGKKKRNSKGTNKTQRTTSDMYMCWYFALGLINMCRSSLSSLSGFRSAIFNSNTAVICYIIIPNLKWYFYFIWPMRFR